MTDQEPAQAPQECRIRREALGWKRGELGRRSRLSAWHVREFEHGKFYSLTFRAHLHNALLQGERRERVDA
jgi:hypothetical protein